MQLHELSDTVEHVVVLGGGTRHLLDDRRNMPKYRRVQQGWKGGELLIESLVVYKLDLVKINKINWIYHVPKYRRIC